ncbi:MAG: hypothetical protein HOL48_01530 [Porticoccaceae bacterium]|jgi:hypothetical protein|nr:hypothetical protein [Porticoccaceae bacterium]
MKNFIVAMGLTMFLAAPASAHHAWAALFDVNGDVEYEAVVESVVWQNPHVVMNFTVNAGTPQEKTVSAASNSVAALARMNVTDELINPGTKVIVAGYPSRSNPEEIFFMNHMLIVDEAREIVFLRTAEARWPDIAARIGDANYAHGLNEQEDISERPTSVFAVWSTIFGAEGSHRALPPAPGFRIAYAEQRGEGDCASKDLWSEMSSPYPVGLFDKREEDGTVIIHVEQNDTIRPVYMDIEHNDPGTVKNNIGYSTGRFAGDTLMVTTTFEGSNSPIQMQETFTLSGDRNHLNYTQVLIDPESNDLPVIGHKWWEFQPNSYVQPYDCVVTEEGNAQYN